jgi:hypothetical protein
MTDCLMMQTLQQRLISRAKRRRRWDRRLHHRSSVQQERQGGSLRQRARRFRAEHARIPMVLPNDREAVNAAIATIGPVDSDSLRVVLTTVLRNDPSCCQGMGRFDGCAGKRPRARGRSRRASSGGWVEAVDLASLGSLDRPYVRVGHQLCGHGCLPREQVPVLGD